MKEDTLTLINDFLEFLLFAGTLLSSILLLSGGTMALVTGGTLWEGIGRLIASALSLYIHTEVRRLGTSQKKDI